MTTFRSLLKPDPARDAFEADTERRWEALLTKIETLRLAPEPLPEHETAVCPKCGWAGVTMRGEECDCHQCDYRWRWPFSPMGLD